MKRKELTKTLKKPFGLYGLYEIISALKNPMEANYSLESVNVWVQTRLYSVH